MDYKKAFEEIINEGEHLVLATAIGDQPHVRIMSYIYDSDTKKVYVSTFMKSAKVEEIAHNNKGAFSIQVGQRAIRVNQASIIKSERPLSEVADAFIAKDPEYEATAKIPGIWLYELDFTQARVIAGFKKVSDIEIS